MASDARQGPALTITGTCEGCAHLRTSNVVLTCAHPQTRKGLTGFAIVATKAKHEDWNMRSNMRHDCPLLPAARLALARSIVAEAEGTTIAALAADECPGKGRCHGAMKWCETCGPVAGTCDDMACDQHDAVHGAGESEEQR